MNRIETRNNIVQARYADAFAIQNQSDMVQIHCGPQGKVFGANKRNLIKHSLYFESVLGRVAPESPIYLDDQDAVVFGLYLLFDHRLCLNSNPERFNPFYDNKADSWERNATLTQMIQLFEMCQALENEILGTHTYKLILAVCQNWPWVYKKPASVDSERDFETANWCLRSFSEAFEHCFRQRELRDTFCGMIIEGFAAGLDERQWRSWSIFLLDFPRFSSQVDHEYSRHDSGCWCWRCEEDRDARYARQTLGMAGLVQLRNRYHGRDSSEEGLLMAGEPFDDQVVYWHR